MWNYYFILFVILNLLILVHEVLSNLHVIGNDVYHHHHKHTETKHKHYMYPVPVYYHEGPKPHLHPYPYHIDGEPHPAHVHRHVKPIPINGKRKRRRISRRRKRHGKRKGPVLEIPVIHHHHPPATPSPVYESALRSLLATPVPSAAGEAVVEAPIRRRAAPVVATPVYQRTYAPVKRAPTILRRASPVLRSSPNLKSAIYNSILNGPVISRPPGGSRMDHLPVIVEDNPYKSSMVEQRPILKSSFLKQKPYRRSSLSNDGFDHLPVIEDDSPVIYESPTMPGSPIESSFIEEGPPIMASSTMEDKPFRKSSIRRIEQFMDSKDESPFESSYMEEKPSRHSIIMDHNPHERAPFLDDEGPTMFGSSRTKDEIFIDSPMEDGPFTSDQSFLKKSSILGGSVFMDSTEDYKSFTGHKTPFRKSSIIRDEDMMESLIRDKPPDEIFMDDQGSFKKSSIRDDPFIESSNDSGPFKEHGSFRSSIMRDKELMESLVGDGPIIEDKPFRQSSIRDTSMEGIHFMDEGDVPFKRSVRKDDKTSENRKGDQKMFETLRHEHMVESPDDNGLFVKTSRLKEKPDEHENIPFRKYKEPFYKSQLKLYDHIPNGSEKPISSSYKIFENGLRDSGKKSNAKYTEAIFKHDKDKKSEELFEHIPFDKHEEMDSKPPHDIIIEEEPNSKSSYKIFDHLPFHEKSTYLKASNEILDFDKHKETQTKSSEKHVFYGKGPMSNLKSSYKIFSHVPNGKEKNSIIKFSDDQFDHMESDFNPGELETKSSHEHIFIDKETKPTSKSSYKMFDHIPFEKENGIIKSFDEKFEDKPSDGNEKPKSSQEDTDHNIFFDKETKWDSKSSYKIFDDIPFDKEKHFIIKKSSDEIFEPSDKHEKVASHEKFEDTFFDKESTPLSKSYYKIFDHVPSDKEKISIEKSSDEIFEHIPSFNRQDEIPRKSSNEHIFAGESEQPLKSSYKIYDHIPTISDSEDKPNSKSSLLSYKIYDHIPSGTESTSKSSLLYRKVRNEEPISTAKHSNKPLKLSRIKDSDLQIPLIADLPKAFSINHISASSVSDRERALKESKDTKTTSEDSTLEAIKSKEERPTIKSYKNIDFKDVKLLASNKEKELGRIRYHPERD
ncbi:hypothetical protein M8J75_016037 [Diaphorina citri]|nr:hypothetical protein M8J75_016037 [Diaphorina citri]